jgi:hypothetical protein
METNGIPESTEMHNGIQFYKFTKNLKVQLCTYLKENAVKINDLDILVSPYNEILIPRTDLSLSLDLPKQSIKTLFKKIQQLGFDSLNEIPRGGYAALYLEITTNSSQNIGYIIEQALEQGYKLGKILPISEVTIMTFYLVGENKELPISNQRILEQVECFRRTEKYQGVPDLKSRLEAEGYIVFTPHTFYRLSDEEQTKVILLFKKQSIKIFADRFKQVKVLKKIVQDDISKNSETGDFNYNFRIVTKDKEIITAVFCKKDATTSSYVPEFMLANREYITRPKGIVTYLLDDLVKDIREKIPKSTIHAGFELDINHDLKVTSINTGCGVATAINAGFKILNQELTGKICGTANGVLPFSYNKMARDNIIPVHGIWMEYPKQV